MNFLILIISSIIVLYLALVYKVYVFFNDGRMVFSVASSMLVPLMIFHLNLKIASEKKISKTKTIVHTFLGFDVSMALLYRIFKTTCEGIVRDKSKPIKVRIGIKMTSEVKKEYNNKMKLAI